MAILVTLVNRSSKTLEGTWDGKHYQLLPGTKYSFADTMAEAFKRQNPVMGSEDPRTLQTQYLIGIEEYGDECTPIEQTGALERWDRTKLPSGGDVEVVPGRNGIFNARDVAQSLPLDSTFVKP